MITLPRVICFGIIVTAGLHVASTYYDFFTDNGSDIFSTADLRTDYGIMTDHIKEKGLPVVITGVAVLANTDMDPDVFEASGVENTYIEVIDLESETLFEKYGISTLSVYKNKETSTAQLVNQEAYCTIPMYRSLLEYGAVVEHQLFIDGIHFMTVNMDKTFCYD